MIACNDRGILSDDRVRPAYWFRVTPDRGHLEHIYYGAKLPDDQPMEPLALKRTAVIGGSVAYVPARG